MAVVKKHVQARRQSKSERVSLQSGLGTSKTMFEKSEVESQVISETECLKDGSRTRARGRLWK